jgi:hypothetical protein
VPGCGIGNGGYFSDGVYFKRLCANMLSSIFQVKHGGLGVGE